VISNFDALQMGAVLFEQVLGYGTMFKFDRYPGHTSQIYTDNHSHISRLLKKLEE
jgi:hypothetical protein